MRDLEDEHMHLPLESSPAAPVPSPLIQRRQLNAFRECDLDCVKAGLLDSSSYYVEAIVNSTSRCANTDCRPLETSLKPHILMLLLHSWDIHSAVLLPPSQLKRWADSEFHSTPLPTNLLLEGLRSVLRFSMDPRVTPSSEGDATT